MAGYGNSSMNEWKLREEMCEIGRRVYNKGFAAANDGNISITELDKEETPKLLLKVADIENTSQSDIPYLQEFLFSLLMD